MGGLVEQKIRQEFDPADVEEALRLLDDSDVNGRAQLAAVKLSEGSIQALRGYLASARVDWRDVIAWAEYPREIAAPAGDATDEMRAADRADYEAWLKS